MTDTANEKHPAGFYEIPTGENARALGFIPYMSNAELLKSDSDAAVKARLINLTEMVRELSEEVAELKKSKVIHDRYQYLRKPAH